MRMPSRQPPLPMRTHHKHGKMLNSLTHPHVPTHLPFNRRSGCHRRLSTLAETCRRCPGHARRDLGAPRPTLARRHSSRELAAPTLAQCQSGSCTAHPHALSSAPQVAQRHTPCSHGTSRELRNDSALCEVECRHALAKLDPDRVTVYCFGPGTRIRHPVKAVGVRSRARERCAKS